MDQPRQPHVFFLPFPAQGHIKPLFLLAKLLSHAGFQVTFINTQHNHERLQSSIDTSEFHNRFPGFHFLSISDGLPPEHPRCGTRAVDLFESTRAVSKTEFRQLLINGESKPTCIIADGIMSFAIDVAEESGIPVFVFRTHSATGTWFFFHLLKLIEEGHVPFPGDLDSEKIISCIPGLGNIFRLRDLPSICRVKDYNDPILQFFIHQTEAMKRASGLILNTFDGLESSIISKLNSLFPKTYTIGPLHGLVKTFIDDKILSDANLRSEDNNCLTWLDSKPPRSVVYVSFGSIISLSHQQLLEFWYGLVNSEKYFLWVIRTDSIIDEEDIGNIPVELESATKKRGLIVKWSPQERVLSHAAIGGFLTHSGWNSTLESIFAGVAMICWPLIADQQVNSRCVEKMWKIGYDMKDVCDRLVVEKLVREVTENKAEAMTESTAEIARTARDSVKEGGTSYCNLEKLIEDLRALSSINREISNK